MRLFEVYLGCLCLDTQIIKEIISQNYLVTNLLIVVHGLFFFFKLPNL